MTNLQEQVRSEILNRLAHTSGNKLAKQLGISSAYISQIKNETTEQIAESTWRALAHKLGISGGWQTFETKAYKTLWSMLEDAQSNSKMLCGYGFTGVGKTTTLKKYASQNANVAYVLCEVTMSQKEFLDEICAALGIMAEGTKSKKIKSITETLNKSENSLLILDDLGKVSDSIYRLVQLLYDRTEHSAGIFLAGTEYLREYIDKARTRNKMGFRELYRRIQFFQAMPPISKKEIESIGKHYNVLEAKALHFLVQKTTCMGTLRNIITNAIALQQRNNEEQITLETLQAVAI